MASIDNPRDAQHFVQYTGLVKTFGNIVDCDKLIACPSN